MTDEMERVITPERKAMRDAWLEACQRDAGADGCILAMLDALDPPSDAVIAAMATAAVECAEPPDVVARITFKQMRAAFSAYLATIRGE